MTSYREFLYEILTPMMGGLIIVLNVLELFMILRDKSRKGVGLVYILNLSISDVFVGLAMIILKIMTPFMKTTLKKDVIAQEFYHVIRYCLIRLSLFVSVFNLIALTFDRLMAIKFPFIHRKKGKSFAIKVCMGVWLLSLACVVLIYSISRFHLNNVGRYNNLVFPIATYTASVVCIICYALIFIELKNSREKAGKQTKRSGEQNKEKEKNDMAFLRLAVKTVAVFILCWIPFSTCSLNMAINGTCGGKNVEFSLFTLAFMNSVVNPFIYFTHAQKLLGNYLQRVMAYFNKRKTENNFDSVSTSKTSVSDSNPQA